MDTFDVIGDSFNAIKQHPKYVIPAILFSIVFLAGAVLIVVSLIFGASHSSITSGSWLPLSLHNIKAELPVIFSALLPALIPFIIVIFLLGVLIKGTYIDLAFKSKNKKASILESMHVAVSRYAPLLAYEIVVAIMDLAIAAIFIVLILHFGYNSVIMPYLNNIAISPSAFIGFVTAAIILGIVYVVVSVAISILFWLGPSIIVLDNKGFRQALAASFNTGKKDAIRIFIVMLLAGVIAGVAIDIASLLRVIPILGAAIEFIVNVVVMAFVQLLAPAYYLRFYKKK